MVPSLCRTTLLHRQMCCLRNDDEVTRFCVLRRRQVYEIWDHVSGDVTLLPALIRDRVSEGR